MRILTILTKQMTCIKIIRINKKEFLLSNSFCDTFITSMKTYKENTEKKIMNIDINILNKILANKIFKCLS